MRTNTTYAIGRMPNNPLYKFRFSKYSTMDKWEKAKQPFSFIKKSGECAGFLKSAHKYESITIFVPIKAVKYLDDKQFIEWIEFINKLGFPCDYMGKNNNNHVGRECYVVNIYPNYYPSTGRHLLACHTLIRYSYSYRYRKISKFALLAYNKLDMNRWKALYFAHLSERNNSNYRGYYGLIDKQYVKKTNKFVYPPDHLGPWEWLKKRNVNGTFTNECIRELPALNGQHVSLTEKNMEEYAKKLNLI